MDTIQVSFQNGHQISCPLGTSAETLIQHFPIPENFLAAVKVNKEIRPLSSRLEINALLEPVSLAAPEGEMIYRRSLAYLMAVAAWELFPNRVLQIGHSLGNSYYYTFVDEQAPTKAEVEELKTQMQELVDEDLPIQSRYIAYQEALEWFEKNNQNFTALLLELKNDSQIQINSCKGFMDLFIEPLVPRTSQLSSFDLMPYQGGLLLRFPGVGRGATLDPFEDSPGIFSVYEEYKKWGRIVGVYTVGHLNQLVAKQSIRDFIQIAEAFQANKIAEIANRIHQKGDSIKVILIAGPSSSGKTITAKRLSLQLQVLGIEPIAISLDDYYLGKAFTPLDENGNPDYERLEALNVPYFNEQLLALLNGEEITLPAYDFKTSESIKNGGKRIRLGRRSILIVEGIHGLNDALTYQIDRSVKFKLYLSALTQLNLDDHNRIPTSDNRLIRRIVRDYQFRGSTAAKTIGMWPTVQEGERKYIFPFQDSADIAFNSALDYELAVLKYYAEPQLHLVKPGQAEFSEAKRLLAFLEHFTPIPPQLVPGNSILREFIGGSDFEF